MRLGCTGSFWLTLDTPIPAWGPPAPILPHGGKAGECTSPVLPAPELPALPHLEAAARLPASPSATKPCPSQGAPGTQRRQPGKLLPLRDGATAGSDAARTPVFVLAGLVRPRSCQPGSGGQTLAEGSRCPAEASSWGAWAAGRAAPWGCHAGHRTGRRRTREGSSAGATPRRDGQQPPRQALPAQPWPPARHQQVTAGGARPAGRCWGSPRGPSSARTARSQRSAGPRAKAGAATWLWHGTAERDRERRSKLGRRRQGARGNKVGADTVPQPWAGARVGGGTGRGRAGTSPTSASGAAGPQLPGVTQEPAAAPRPVALPHKALPTPCWPQNDACRGRGQLTPGLARGRSAGAPGAGPRKRKGERAGA